jgi:shikimate kinase
LIERVLLVGFMGAGKTTVGRCLADRLGWKFVDLDLEIERQEGRSIAEIFRTRWESYFRRVERACLEAVAAERQAVVSVGGGAYVDQDNRALVDSLGLSVYLEASLDVLLDRVGEDASRPLASDRVRLEQLFALRSPSYKMASMTIETGGLGPDEIADAVMKRVRP